MDTEPNDMDQEDADVTVNRYRVEVCEPDEVDEPRWLRLRRPPLTLDRSSALCLIGWVATLLNLTDEEIRETRTKIEPHQPIEATREPWGPAR